MASTENWTSSRFGGPRPTRMNRLVARLRGRSIDDRLLTGLPVDENPVTLARLAQLLDRGYRSTVARALRRVLEVARQRQLSPYLAQLPLRITELLETEPLILTLADELEEEESVSPRGVILADRLIRDGDSPLYWRSSIKVSPEAPDDSIESAVRHARAALLLN